NGWVEHDPLEIWESQLEVAKTALSNLKEGAQAIAAIGITNQRETVVVWDRQTGKPIYRAIVWQDKRTTEFCQQLKSEGKEELFRSRTGLVLDAYFSGTKIAWILDHVPGARKRAEQGELMAGTIDTWLIYKLSGHRLHVTDPSNASRTLLFNIHTLDWDEELLNILAVPKSLLPKVGSSSEQYGTTAAAILGAEIPISGIAGDQQAALFGQQCTEVGMVKNTYGTGCFMLMNVGEEPVLSKANLLTTVAWSLGGKTTYALEGSVFMAGAVVQWLRDSLGFIEASSEVEALAARVPDSGGVYFVPAFVGLGAPYWDPYARGQITGLTRGTTKAHIARAALDAIAYQTLDVLTAMQQDAATSIRVLKVDGGASANNLLMQFQADILRAEVLRPKQVETTAMGAAFLAGLAVGFWSSLKKIQDISEEDKRFIPQGTQTTINQGIKGWHSAVNTCLTSSK
ncbi:MAG: glycerol kinase GlpK, partial [Bacteroidetes bacterium]|nr:glycerol kinase GlpK [Bacteroidota bacterium]